MKFDPENLREACRDCCALTASKHGRCLACGSVRIVSHPQLMMLSVAHVDCDAFYAAIEKRDNPALAARPVIVGGGKRGVVSTCCYLARTFGVRSAMPMFKALKACPEAVIVKPRMSVYVEEGRKIREMMLALTPQVEPVSIDEAYLDLAGTAALHGAPPAISLMRLQKRVEQELGLTISVGLASNKFLAKTASEADKPRGFFVLSPEEAPAYLAPRSVRIIGGVGAAFAARLAADGVQTVGDLQKLGARTLVRRYGDQGLWLHNCAFGRHGRPVDPRGERKSISSETTLNEDVSDHAVIEDILWRLCERTADRAKRSGVEGRVVVLKLKTSNFHIITRRASLADATQLAQALFRTVRALLAKEPRGPGYRLVGVGISDLAEAGPDVLDLADPTALKRAAAERAADKARSRFGSDAVTTGRGARARRD
ncbi:MAG: DNA polymerase IV [Alphaproteobacteria bacterium]|nr:DNA polymerase IV [Alphaproteobacteria bacterium]